MMQESAERGASATSAKSSMLDQYGISIERLPGLAVLLDQFALQAGAQLQPLFGHAPASTIEELKTSSTFDELGRSEGCLAATLACADLDTRLLLVLEPCIFGKVVASAFGADRVEDQAVAQAPTTIATRLVEEFVRLLGTALAAAFSQTAKAAFTFEGAEALSDVFALGRRDSPVAIARLQVRLSAGSCDCVVLMPQALLQALRRELSVDTAPRAVMSDPRWTREMEMGVTKARIAVTAVLEEFELTLEDVANFSLGQVLDLRGNGMGRIRLECAGRGIFWGRVGQAEGRYSMEIEDPIDGDGELADVLLAS